MFQSDGVGGGESMREAHPCEVMWRLHGRWERGCRHRHVTGLLVESFQDNLFDLKLKLGWNKKVSVIIAGIIFAYKGRRVGWLCLVSFGDAYFGWTVIFRIIYSPRKYEYPFLTFRIVISWAVIKGVCVLGLNEDLTNCHPVLVTPGILVEDDAKKTLFSTCERKRRLQSGSMGISGS